MAINKSENGLEELFRRLHEPLMEFCLAKLHSDRQAAGDCLDGVFRAAREHAEELLARPDPEAWFYSACAIEVRRWKRADRKYRRPLVSFEEIEGSDSQPLMVSIAGREYDEATDGYTSSFLERDMPAEKAERIKREILASLRKDEQKLYELIFAKHFSLTAAAAELGIAPDAVRMRKNRLVLKLRRALNEYLKEFYDE